MRFFGDKFKKFARTKFFIISASVAVFLTVFPIVLSAMGRGDILKSGVNLIATPFKSVAAFCGNAVDGFFDYFTEFNRLKDENKALREELLKEQQKNDAADVALAENEWLKKFLLFSQQNPEYLLIEAKTVGRDSGDYIATFTLNKGSNAGIETGMSVITPEGLIGYVSEVGLNYSKVKTLLGADVSVGVICERSGAYGILEGNFGYSEDGLCKMTCAEGDADLQVGDLIVTSGVGSVYSYGLMIGRVSSVEVDKYDRKLTAYVEPIADFSQIYRVMVISERQSEGKNE